MNRMRARSPLVWTILLLALAACPGCSKPSVHGQVTYDGQPMDGGRISFIPTGGQGKSATADIVAGKYTIPANLAPGSGTYKVEIYWKQKTGRKVPVPGDPGSTTDEAVEVVPPAYNSSSVLTKEIKGGDNTLDFEVKSR